MTEVTRDTVKAWIPRRSRTAHKGDFGRVHILAGKVGYTGAPYFAAEGAVRSGAGLVYLHVPQAIWSVVACKCNEAMVFPLEEDVQHDAWSRADAMLVGPGLGRSEETDTLVRRLTQELEMPLVLDADGITAFAGHIDSLKAREGRLTVLTPHEGELSRLLGNPPSDSDRTALAERVARELGCVLVLKGHRTVTAFPDGTLFLNTTGNPGMAKGGSGDVLAGVILALLGQGLPPKEAVPAAVWLHGRAGDLAAESLGEYGMCPTDLLGNLPAAFQF